MFSPALPLALALILAVMPLAIVAAGETSTPDSVYGFTARSNDGQEVALAQFQGNVLLIVNTASQCGYTSQYAGLQTLHQKYNDRGFQVLAFPANEFGGQEPGTDAEIRAFCVGRYNVTFPLFAKVVVKGPGQHPLFTFLTSPEANPQAAGEIPWNFTKFLVDRQGKVIARFDPKVEPESAELTSAIEKALSDSP